MGSPILTVTPVGRPQSHSAKEPQKHSSKDRIGIQSAIEFSSQVVLVKGLSYNFTASGKGQYLQGTDLEAQKNSSVAVASSSGFPSTTVYGEDLTIAISSIHASAITGTSFPATLLRRPFPKFSHGPMIKSSHQRAKLTIGQIKRLSKTKSHLLDAEKTLTFNVFEKLPLELRYMIYALMIPDRRVIEIKEPRRGHNGQDRGNFLLSYEFPAILYISSEARQWAEKTLNYTKSFKSNLNSHTIYYNPECDSPLFHSLRLLETFFGAEFSSPSLRPVLEHQLLDHSKQIEAPLFLACNHAWELNLTADNFRLLGQPRNLILARKSGQRGNMDEYTVHEIIRVLGKSAKTRGTSRSESIIPPEMVCQMTFKELRDKINELNHLEN